MATAGMFHAHVLALAARRDTPTLLIDIAFLHRLYDCLAAEMRCATLWGCYEADALSAKIAACLHPSYACLAFATSQTADGELFCRCGDAEGIGGIYSRAVF